MDTKAIGKAVRASAVIWVPGTVWAVTQNVVVALIVFGLLAYDVT